MLLCFLNQCQGLRLHCLPAGFERRNDDRLHNEQNVLLAGVVRSELGALGGVKAALKEGSEDGRLYVGPIQDSGGAQRAISAEVRSKTESSEKRPPLTSECHTRQSCFRWWTWPRKAGGACGEVGGLGSVQFDHLAEKVFRQ